MEYFIDKLTLPGAIVVDPYCGSGTVPAACKKLGRRWLACEVDSGTANCSAAGGVKTDLMPTRRLQCFSASVPPVLQAFTVRKIPRKIQTRQ